MDYSVTGWSFDWYVFGIIDHRWLKQWNVLLSDNYYRGCVVSLTMLRQFKHVDSITARVVRAGASLFVYVNHMSVSTIFISKWSDKYFHSFEILVNVEISYGNWYKHDKSKIPLSGYWVCGLKPTSQTFLYEILSVINAIKLYRLYVFYWQYYWCEYVHHMLLLSAPLNMLKELQISLPQFELM